ncbi:DUF6543 domain-containing protein [Pseudomonas sp. OST1909]|uniref:dermonecrotic toxin domain-containing protein n=1 Tax=Pseudomonas sp. OST1909 TaxID=2777367 RepID=UPI00188742A9|nr:DUF6543 domain-containing protein [Pseudomonas sp. OST1909]QOY69367.1 hypothetical protein IH404_16280 [Pseudomonas sp. OST1909]
MPTPSSPTALSQLPAQAIHTHFATRPALYSVVFNALRSHILERYPALKLDLSTVKLAIPDPNGVYTFRPLMEVAIAHVLNPQLLDLRPKRELAYYLTQQVPQILKPDTPPLIDMRVIANIIDALPESIHLYFQAALADYWSETDSHGSSRWQWLGEFLNGRMTAIAASQSNLNATQRDMLRVVATWPVQAERLPQSSPATYVYLIENTFTHAGEQVSLLTPDLLLMRDKQVLLYSVAGDIQVFDSLDDFGAAWGARMQARFQFDSLTWRRNEPDGNVFEQQAGLILNQQLEDLATLKFQGQDERTLERRLEKLTDPALLFTQVPTAAAATLQKVNEQLPPWLAQASAADRFAYHRHMQDMAQVLQHNQGRAFNEGIENIYGFSRAALRKQMQADHGDCDPDEVVLDFAVAAGYPGGAGIIEHVRMSLTELALKNLAGKPKGTLTLFSKNATPLPSWLNEDYLLGSTGLIQRVDIGATYPQTIKDTLLSDTADARRRETLFTRELKVKLPMQALEYKIRGQHGVTVTGYRYVKALMGEMPSDRIVDDQEIVLRPLALCRKPGAAPDEVNNAFIIEPRDASVGPHLLYQPLYTDALHEFPTRQALLDALTTPGVLQGRVLAWLSDRARPVYDEGGIKEPHIIRFVPGDEFRPRLERPAPATLAVDEGAGEWLQSQVNGQLLNHLFGSTARALVDLADRESVSNHESRWAVVMEGAWLLFNTLLLPLVQGPAMLAGWFMVLVSSLEQDLSGLDSSDPTTRELALIDLLLNTAMVLLHATAPSDRSPRPLSEPSAQEHALHLETWHRSAGLPPAQEAPIVRHGPVSLPGEPPATGHTALDFGHSISSPHAGAKLLKALLDVQVPWPTPLPSPLPHGVLKGLYWIDGKWHASFGGLLFQANVVQGFNEVYLVHPDHPQHPGFKLVSDGQGHWRLDRRARLEGGMPRERLSKWKSTRDERIRALTQEFDALLIEMDSAIASTTEFESALNTARANLADQATLLRKDWLLLSTSAQIPELHAQVTRRHAARRVNTAQARAQWEAALDNYQQNGRTLIPLMQRIEVKADELMKVDRTNHTHRQRRDKATRIIYSYWSSVFSCLAQKMADTLVSDNGENCDELGERANRELPENITHAYDEYINTKTRQVAALNQMIEPAEQIETFLKQADPALRPLLLEGNPSDQDISSVAIKQHAMLVFTDLVFNRTHRPVRVMEFPFIRVLTDPQLASIVLAHTEMRTTSGYSTVEQIDVLKGALERYEQLENAVNSLHDMNSGLVREAYRESYLKHLDEARSGLETQLANLILVEEKLATRPARDKSKRQKPATRRVIKTVDQKSLIGDLRPSKPNEPVDYVDITDTLTGEVVSTYQGRKGKWTIVAPPSEPRTAPTPAARSLKTIRADGEALKNERTGIDASIGYQQHKLLDPIRREEINPSDWEVMLTQHAARFTALAEELKTATDEHAIALRKSYEKAAIEATAQAYQLCGEGYLLQRPKAAKVDFLHTHKFVTIHLVKKRVPLKAGDFLTEYAIRDKRKIPSGKRPEDADLWYAHFHYPSVDSPASTPSFGHLKTPAERRFTRKELMEQAKANNRAVINLDKAVIGAPLDQKLFLGLEV